jgi:RHS repeat-associated protein
MANLLSTAPYQLSTSTGRLLRAGALLLFLQLSLIHAAAQTYYSTTTSPTDGTTPNGLAPGTPAGSFPLSGFDNINPFSGSLNFSLPLLRIGGRGASGYTMTLPIEQRWRVEFFQAHCDDASNGGGDNCGTFQPVWSTYADYNWWTALKPGYGPGVIIGRRIGVGRNECPYVSPANYAYTLSRLTFIAPDGTETELRDQLHQGEAQPVSNVCLFNPGASRGTVFVSADGSAMTFISDSVIYDDLYADDAESLSNIYPSGYLLLRDGTRYRFDGGQVTWIRDRNGNRNSFTYGASGVSTITDSLNRQVQIEYNVNDVSPYGLCDRITYKGFGGGTRMIRVSKTSLENALRAGFSIQTDYQLFPETYGPYMVPALAGPFNPQVTSAVWLPDGRSYRLLYNSYGELARVELPTGGAFEYDWSGGSVNWPDSGVIAGRSQGAQIYRRVIERRVYQDRLDNSSLETKMTVSRITGAGEVIITDPTIVDVIQSKPDNQAIDFTRHYYYGNPTNDLFTNPGGAFLYNPWQEGKEYKTEALTSDGASVLRRVENNWQQGCPVSSWSNNIENNPRISDTLTTLVDTNQVTKRTFSYDCYNNQTDVYEHGFGAGAPGPLIRRTYMPYLTTNGNQGDVDYAADLNIHIRNLPIQNIVYDASGNVSSQTDFIYDDYGVFPLVDCPGIVQHDGGFHTGYGARGNLTGMILRNPGGSPSEIKLNDQYDIAGNLVKAVNGRGFATVFDFSDRFGLPGNDARSNSGAPELAGGFSYAFPTKVTNALDQTTYTQFDYYLGRAVTAEDANGVVSSVAYNDVLDRPTQGIQARYKVGVGVPAERRQMTVTYDDTNRVITTASDLNTFNDGALTAKSYYDELGRTWRSAAREAATWTITDTRFDPLGRVSQVSNPYRSADPGSASPPSDLWTKTNYDALGRAIRLTTPDDAHVDTAYSGNQVTVTDQAGKGRLSETDALGRLIRVTEDPGNLNYDTFYFYDALGNLLQVTQGSQSRTFAYDSLSRLISAANPESGTTTYAYDQNGNLIEKKDPRGVRRTLTYDALNRVRSKVYAGLNPEGAAAADATPPVNYFYDDYSTLPSGAPSWPGTPSKGRLIGVTYGTGSEGTYYKYNALGRVATNHQRQGTSNYATAYLYNLAGAVTREERLFGSNVRRRNSMSYDAAGRLALMRTGYYSGASFVQSDLVSNISYTPFGALQSETYGNGLIHSMGYNERLQPTEIRLGTTSNPESVFRMNYIFGTANNVNGQDPEITAVHNNGNIARVKYFISGALQYAQTFQYDPLNRLRYAVEHSNGVYNDGARAWYQTFDYDRYGNCGMNVENTSDNVDAANSALKLADFSAADNRITRAGHLYDAAGNLIAEPGKSYTYDAENRIVTATVAGGATSQYIYDGNGRRVKKAVGGVATRYEYGKDGELNTEWNDADTNRVALKDYFYAGGSLATTKTGTSGEYEYATADHLGSPRAWTGKDGNLVAGGRHDYSPFGEELSAGVGIRSASLGYGDDSVRQKFTSKERDSETGLDYFLARYYSSAQGRFISPDEFTGGPDALFSFADAASANPTFYADLTNPQSLNKYQYTYNNPLSYTDSDGHCPECPVYYVMNKIQEVDRKITQLKTDFVDYGKGLAKSAANAVIDIGNIGNMSMDDAGHLHGKYERYEPSNEVQAMGMNSGDKLMILSIGLGKPAPVNVAMAEGEGAAVVAPKVPGYVVSPDGTAFPVPKGAQGPVPVVNEAGKTTGVAFTGGKGGANGQGCGSFRTTAIPQKTEDFAEFSNC